MFQSILIKKNDSGSVRIYIFVYETKKGRLRVMMCNATFNIMSVISWWIVLLVEKMEVPEVSGENH
jgi:hypothetical protein